MLRHFLKLFVIILCFFILSICFFYSPTPTVSVVMATYNRSSFFLPRAIESILSQTYQDYEFIIIDDASTDETEKILDKYQKKDKRIRVFRNNKNQGLVYNLNKGLDLARGKYIARMDDDDISLPERFAKQVAYMDKSVDIDLLGASRYLIGYNPNNVLYAWTSQTNKHIAAIDALFFTSAAHPTWMIRRSFINKNHIRYDSAYENAEDRKFLIDVIFAGGSIVSLKEILLGYERKSLKKNNYYETQSNSHSKAVRFAFEHFYQGVELEKILRGTLCDQYNALLSLPPEKNIFDYQTLQQKTNDICHKK